MMIESDARHFDFPNKLTSIRAALVDRRREVAALGVECVLLLRRSMWERGSWREFQMDVMAALHVALEVTCDSETAARLQAYQAGLNAALGNWHETRTLAKRALEVSKHPEVRSEALYHLGAANHDLGHSRRARRQLRRALCLASDQFSRINIMHKLHRVEGVLGNYKTSDRMFAHVLSWARAHDNEWFLAELLLDRAGRLHRDYPDQAMTLTSESRRIYEKLGFERGIAYSDLEFGRIFHTMGQSTEARTALAAARAALERQSYYPGLAHVHLAYGMIDLATGDALSALNSFEQSLRHAETAGYSRATIRAASLACRAAFLCRSWTRLIIAAVQLISALVGCPSRNFRKLRLER